MPLVDPFATTEKKPSGLVDPFAGGAARDLVDPFEAKTPELVDPIAAPTPVTTPSSITRRALGDTGVALAKGLISVPQAAIGLGDIVTGGEIGKGVEGLGLDLKGAQDYWQGLYSPEAQAAQADVSRSFQEGIMPGLASIMRNPSTIQTGAVESLPISLTGGVIGKGLTAVPAIARLGPVASRAVAAGIGEGLPAMGAAAEQIRAETPDGKLTGRQSGLAAGSGILTAVLGAAGGSVAAAMKIGDIDVLTGGPRTVMAVIKGMVQEGLLEELPQSLQEQIAQNLALGKPWDEGVAQSGAMGAVIGAIMGGGANVLPRGAQAPQQPPSADIQRRPTPPQEPSPSPLPMPEPPPQPTPLEGIQRASVAAPEDTTPAYDQQAAQLAYPDTTAQLADPRFIEYRRAGYNRAEAIALVAADQADDAQAAQPTLPPPPAPESSPAVPPTVKAEGEAPSIKRKPVQPLQNPTETRTIGGVDATVLPGETREQYVTRMSKSIWPKLERARRELSTVENNPNFQDEVNELRQQVKELEYDIAMTSLNKEYYAQTKGHASKKISRKKLYRGTTRQQWEAIQGGDQPQSEFTTGGNTWATTSLESAQGYTRETGENAVIIEYKDSAHDKVSKLTDDPGDHRRQGPLVLDDIQRVTDGNGKVLYDASKNGTEKPGEPTISPTPTVEPEKPTARAQALGQGVSISSPSSASGATPKAQPTAGTQGEPIQKQPELMTPEEYVAAYGKPRKGATSYSGNTRHASEIGIAVNRDRKPVSASAVDAYGIKLPEGYVREGDRYVFRRESKPGSDRGGTPAQTPRPAEPSQTAAEPVSGMDRFRKATATKRMGGIDVPLSGEAIGDYLVHPAQQVSGEKGYMVMRISTGETVSGDRSIDRDLARRMASEQAATAPEGEKPPELTPDGTLAWQQGLQVAKSRASEGKIILRPEFTRGERRPGVALSGDWERDLIAANNAWDYFKQSDAFDPQAEPPTAWRNEVIIDKAMADWIGMPERGMASVREGDRYVFKPESSEKATTISDKTPAAPDGKIGTKPEEIASNVPDRERKEEDALTKRQSQFRKGQKILVRITANGKKYNKPMRGEVIQVLDANTIRVKRQNSKNKKQIEDIDVERISLLPSVEAQRRRSEQLAEVKDPQQRKQVAKDAAEFNELLYRELADPEDLRFEDAENERSRQIGRSLYMRKLRSRTAEELGDKTMDLENPVVRAQMLPKLKELISSRNSMVNPEPSEPSVNETELADGDFVKKDGKWYKVERDESGKTTLADEVDIVLDDFQQIAIDEAVANGTSMADKAEVEWRKQEKKAESVNAAELTLESQTPEQIEAEKAKAKRAELKAKMEAERTKPLVAKELDTTGDLLDPNAADNPLFAARKPDPSSKPKNRFDEPVQQWQVVDGEKGYANKQSASFAAAKLQKKTGTPHRAQERAWTDGKWYVEQSVVAPPRSLTIGHPLAYTTDGETIQEIPAGTRAIKEGEYSYFDTPELRDRKMRIAAGKGLSSLYYPIDTFGYDGENEFPELLKKHAQEEAIKTAQRTAGANLLTARIDDAREAREMTSTPAPSPSAAATSEKHVAIYNGKEAEADTFKQAAQRVSDNLTTGEHGYVRSPNGKLFEISNDKKTAMPVKEMRTKRERDISILEERISKAKYPGEREALSKQLQDLKSPSPSASVAPKPKAEPADNAPIGNITKGMKFRKGRKTFEVVTAPDSEGYFDAQDVTFGKQGEITKNMTADDVGQKVAKPKSDVTRFAKVKEITYDDSIKVERIETPEALRDALAQITKGVVERFGPDAVGEGYSIVDPESMRMPDPTNRNLPSVEKRARNVLERVFGKKIVFVDGPKLFGAVTQGNNDIIWVHSKAKAPLTFLIGHELVHQMKKDSPEVFMRLARVVESEMVASPSGSNQIMDAISSGGKPAASAMLEERIADKMGSEFNKPDFWKRLAQTEPSIFQKVYNAMTNLIGKIKAAIKFFNYNVDPLFSKVFRVELAMQDAMRDYAKQRQGKEAYTGADGTKGEAQFRSEDNESTDNSETKLRPFSDIRQRNQNNGIEVEEKSSPMASRGTLATEAQAERIVRRILGPAADLTIVDRIYEGGKRRLGKYQAGLTTIARGGDMERTAYHESFHAAEDMLFTDDERSRVEEIEPDAEKRADAFMDYAAKRQGISGQLRQLFDRLMFRIKALFGSSNKIDEMNAIHARMMAGEFGRRVTEQSTAREGETVDEYTSLPTLITKRSVDVEVSELLAQRTLQQAREISVALEDVARERSAVDGVLSEQDYVEVSRRSGIPFIQDAMQLGGDKPLSPIGRGNEGFVVRPENGGVVYKVYSLHPEGIGVTVSPVVGDNGKINPNARYGDIGKLLDRIAIGNKLGFTPTEIVAITGKGELITKQPFADAKNKSGGLQEQQFISKAVPIPDGKLDIASGVHAWLASYEGRMYFVTDVKMENTVKDTAGRVRGNDPAIAEVSDSFIQDAGLEKEAGEARRIEAGREATSFRNAVTGEQDARYAELAEKAKSGDKQAEAEAQRMVDEAAKAAGYNVGPVWHGTADAFTEFDLDHPNRKDTGWLGTGVYATSDMRLAESYSRLKEGASSPRTLKLVAKMTNPYRAALRDKQKLQLLSNLKGTKAGREAADQWTRSLKEAGHDGVILKYDAKDVGEKNASTEYVVFDTAAVKSADAFTYRDDGTLISLFDRFQRESPDIRYFTAQDQTEIEAETVDTPKALETSIERLERMTAKAKDAIQDEAMVSDEPYVKMVNDVVGQFKRTFYRGMAEGSKETMQRIREAYARIRKLVPIEARGRMIGYLLKEGRGKEAEALAALEEGLDYWQRKTLKTGIAKMAKKVERSTGIKTGIDIEARNEIKRMTKGVNLGELSTDELTALHATIATLMNRGKLQRQVETAVEDYIQKQAKRDIAEQKGSYKFDDPEKTSLPTDDVGWNTKMGDFLKKLVWNVRNTDLATMGSPRMFQFLDGLKVGAATKWFYHAVSMSENRSELASRPVLKRVYDVVKKHKFTDSQFKKIGVYAAYNQKGGMDKLQNIDARYTEESVAKIAQEVESNEGMMEFYRTVRAEFDRVRPQIQAVLKDVYNRDMKEVDNYWSFMTDFLLSDDDSSMYSTEVGLDGEIVTTLRSLGKSANLKQNPAKEFADTRKGAGNQKINLDALYVATKKLQDMYYFVNTAKDIKRAGEIARSQEVLSAYGKAGQRLIRQWIDVVARRGGTTGVHNIKALDTLINNMGVGQLGFRLSSMAIQPVSMLNAVGTLGRHALQGYADMLKPENRKFIEDNMPEILSGAGKDVAAREVGESLGMKKFRTYGMTPLVFFDRITRAGVALGAYHKKLAEMGIEYDTANPNAEAIRYAQDVAAMTQGTGHFKDAPLIITRGMIGNSKTLTKLIMQFQTYPMNVFHMMVTDGLRAGIKTGNYGKLAAIIASVNAAYFVEGLIRYGLMNIPLIGGGSDDDKDKTMMEFLAKNQLSNITGGIPLVGPAMRAAQYDAFPAPVMSAISDVVGGYKSALTAKSDAAKARGAVRATGAALGLAGLPGTTQAAQVFRRNIKSAKEETASVKRDAITDELRELDENASIYSINRSALRAHRKLIANGELPRNDSYGKFRAQFKRRYDSKFSKDE